MKNDKVPCKIAVDVMGSDKGPSEFVRALFELNENPNFSSELFLVGKKRLIDKLISVRKEKINLDKIIGDSIILMGSLIGGVEHVDPIIILAIMYIIFIIKFKSIKRN